MTQQVQENKEPWFVSDDILNSYVYKDLQYDTETKIEEFKWFNLDIKIPPETDKERQESEVCKMQQVKLGIIRYDPPQQQIQQPGIQPPENALDPELARFMECRITPAFISKLNGQDVNLNELPNSNNTKQPVQHQEQILKVQQPVKKLDSVIDDILGVKKSSNKLNFQMNGKKVGKNDPCPCGSGQKFKKCHGR